jgi:hypothetical protein
VREDRLAAQPASAAIPLARRAGWNCGRTRMMLVNAAVTRLGRASAVALLVAAAGGVGLIVAAFLAPMYATMSASSSGELTHGTDTLVGVNGLGVLVVIGVPLLATLAVGGALWHGSRRGAVPVAWMLAGLLAVFNMLAMLSVGVFSCLSAPP